MKISQAVVAVVMGALLFTGSVFAQNYVMFNGGISMEERQAAPTNGTKLVFAATAGNYLSGVTVNIKNASGADVVNTVTEGPWLILNLPSGQYSVNAQISSGEKQHIEINVDGSNQQFNIAFSSVP